MTLGRDDILKADDLPRREVSVPEWGGHVYVRTMTGAQRDALEASMVNGKGGANIDALKNLRARIAALTICDEDGNLIFDEKDIGALSAKSAAALNRVFEVSQDLNSFGDEAIEELAKNSEAARSGASGSG